MVADEARDTDEPVPQRTITLGKAVVLLACQSGVMIAMGMLLWHLSGRDAAAFVTVSAAQAIQGLALGLALIALAFALFRGLPRVGETLVRMQAETYAFLGPRLGLGAIGFISLCAGVGEEALFRAGMQTFLGDHVGAPVAIALSSAVFAAIHLGKPVITLLLFVVGAIFGTVYWLTGSLLAAMIGHTLYDIWALKYLHGEFVRLGLLDEKPPPPLANPVPPG
jgi:membrane protease YdiL (CAAX protease family)